MIDNEEGVEVEEALVSVNTHEGKRQASKLRNYSKSRTSSGFRSDTLPCQKVFRNDDDRGFWRGVELFVASVPADIYETLILETDVKLSDCNKINELCRFYPRKSPNYGPKMTNSGTKGSAINLACFQFPRQTQKANNKLDSQSRGVLATRTETLSTQSSI